ncbi:MobP3 family relaxase [Tepidanaerobacter acetatoxydans]|uniref:MobP3 family relaxase n=1 Tax=Tepidanaerobacter acetatoxydans TaxID=499229 RepID=UPI001BD208B2|nr:MobP3 family relaxase [Tepidanaerobacter acetatoxydans]
MKSPFVFINSFKDPESEKDVHGKNAGHVEYIGTRSGVDLGEVEITPDMDAGHIKYMDERPGSHGLFSQEEGIPNMKEVQKELLNHKGLSWRWILSLEEGDAVEMGYTNRKAWEKMVRATMKDAAAAMGIPESNLRWVAAFHGKKGHPHVHVMFWEKEPHRKVGELSEGELKDVKRIFVREMDAGERTRLEAEKTALRDLIRDAAGSGVLSLEKGEEVLAFTGENPGLEPLMTQNTKKELVEKLNELAAIMPGRGRIALKYMPPAAKDKAREISAWLLMQPGFLNSTEKYKELSEQLAKYFVKKDERLDKAADKAFEDIRDRVAHLVLKGAVEIQKVENIAEQKAPEWEENEPLPPESLGEDLIMLSEGEYEKDFIIDTENYKSREGSFSQKKLSHEENISEKIWRSTCYILGKEYIAQNPGADMLVPDMGRALRSEVMGTMADISDELPQIKGKIKFDYLSPELQKKITDMAKFLLSQEQLQGRAYKIANNEGLVRQIADQVILRASETKRDFADEIDMHFDSELAVKAIKELLVAKADLVRNDHEESKWTVETIYRTFVFLGKESEALDTAERFGNESGLSSKEVTDAVRKAENKIDFFKKKNIPLCIGREDWQRLTENLGLTAEDFQKPWYGKISIEKKTAKDLWRTACYSLGREAGKLTEPNMKSDFKNDLINHLKNLSKKIPDLYDKIEYKQVPENIREEAEITAKEMLSQKKFKENFSKLSIEQADSLIYSLAEQIIIKAKSLTPREFTGNSTPLIDEELVPGVVEKIKSSDGSLIQKDENEIKWTVRTIYRTFVFLGKESEALDAALEFAAKAGMLKEVAEEAINKEKVLLEYQEREGRPKCIYRNDWQRLGENLGLKEKEFLRPWTGAKNAEGKTAEKLWRTTCFSLARELKKDSPGLSMLKPQISDSLKKEIVTRLQGLADSISQQDQKGRPSYAYLSEDLQEQARETAQWLLNREELQGRYNMLVLEGKEELIHRMAEHVVSRACDLMPREFPDGIKMVIHEIRRQEAIERMRDANANFIDDKEEILWTVKAMYRTLVYLEKEEDEAQNTALKFAAKAGISKEVAEGAMNKEKTLLEYLDNADPGRSHCIGHDDWQRLGENLGLKEEEFLRPWFGVKGKDESEREASRKLREELGVTLMEERIAGAVAAFENSCFHPGDLDELRWTITTMASILKGMNIDETERDRIVRSWCRRSGVKITEAKLRDILDRTTVSDTDIWLGKKSWSRLMENLGIEEEKAQEGPWQVGRPMLLSQRIAGGVWKSVWKSLERERSKAEAQSRYASMMVEKEAEMKAKRGQVTDAAIDRL